MLFEYQPVKLSVAPTSQVGTGAILETEKANINHLIKVMEVLYIICAVCVCVGAYDTIKQHHAIKQLDKQLKQSLTLK